MEKYFKYYTAVAIQSNFHPVSSREDLKSNAKRAVELIDWALGGLAVTPGWAPIKLLVFPEFFLQGWTFEEGADKIAAIRDRTIKIPGEETDILSKKAIKAGIYIAGVALEVDPRWPEHIINCGFIIGPDGKVILKYHKITPALDCDVNVSPHDIYDSYIKHSKYGADLRTFFPVVDTPIGRLGYFICYDGRFPENPRALAMNGAEILLRSSGNVEPFGSPPVEAWEIENRFHAMANLVYVVAATQGRAIGLGCPEDRCPGRSMIVDFNGTVLCKIDHPGETMTGAVINLDALRRRRMDPTLNYLAQVRTEVYREIYKETIYPPNLYLKKGFSSYEERDAKIESLVKRGIYVKPKED